ncbi:MAG: formylmethanofuran--tetrahydromethanopterin N-formyltransferase [Pirellulales bacterium]
MQNQAVECAIEDTYAEAFKGIYAEVLITARDREWLDRAVAACTGHASSTIMCDCEAGVVRYVDGSQSPDNRVGAIVQFHVPKFKKNRERHLEKVLIARLSQNVLTCPTARVFNLLEGGDYFSVGKKIAFFGDGHQFRAERFDEELWVIPIMGGEFEISRRFGFREGVMGGNLWFMGQTVDAAITAASAAAVAADAAPGVVTTFPGGVASSASKAGSKYKFLIASTFEKYCPTLREKLGDQSGVPADVKSIMEIIVNGESLEAVANATYAAINAARSTPGLKLITAGNYNGRLGKSFIYLRPELH